MKITEQKIKEILLATKNVLLKEGWIQGAFWNEDGCCLVGGIQEAFYAGLDSSEMAQICSHLMKFEEFPPLGPVLGKFKPERVRTTSWNDSEGRTFGEVIDLLERASE